MIANAIIYYNSAILSRLLTQYEAGSNVDESASVIAIPLVKSDRLSFTLGTLHKLNVLWPSRDRKVDTPKIGLTSVVAVNHYPEPVPAIKARLRAECICDSPGFFCIAEVAFPSHTR
ncbi:hypothetical protein METHB2_50054 [Candidatus Methylobacter favarea]|uniref:Uncharacterized protein n=1 Tax=Candidatus Methylobacter favarea TaxID=2707345 RepID=A0A8S0WBL7_9GAMM|nr:hypothetical protein METHB2_50054 [Candidatus Methylobacter favarea]